jgi:hypothetical protein
MKLKGLILLTNKHLITISSCSLYQINDLNIQNVKKFVTISNNQENHRYKFQNKTQDVAKWTLLGLFSGIGE